MGAPRLRYLPDLLEIHFGELQNVWARRRAARRSREHTLRTLAALDERIAAHTQGLLAAGNAVRPLVEPALTDDDRDAAFAAAHTLLRLAAPDGARAVVRAVAGAAPRARRGLAEALAHGPATTVEPLYAALAAAGEPGAMAVATEVLAYRGALRAAQARSAIDELVAHAAADIRAAGWRAAGDLGARMTPPQYAAAWRDDAPNVRRAALEAAVWAREPSVVAFGRACASRAFPEPLEALYVLAVLAGHEDVPHVAAAARAIGGPAHLALLGTLGSPAYVDEVVATMAHPDPAVAAAAQVAFAKLTGHDVRSSQTATTAALDADPFDAAFAAVVALPDAERARVLWAEMRPTLSGAGRLCGGIDVRDAGDAEPGSALDLESRWERALRARYSGVWAGLPRDLDALRPVAVRTPSAP